MKSFAGVGSLVPKCPLRI